MNQLFNIFIILLGIVFVSCNNNQNHYPILEYTKETITDTIFNYKLNDPYRSLENSNDSTFISWLQSQNTFAHQHLKNITNWDSMFNYQSSHISKQYRPSLLRITPNDYYFYVQDDSCSSTKKLYYKLGYNGNTTCLYNPENYKPDLGQNWMIGFIEPSWDATKVAVSLSKNDEEISEIIIIDVKSHTVYPYIINNCMSSSFHDIQWLPDNSGFTYIHFPLLGGKNIDGTLDGETVLYKLGSDPKNKHVLLSRKNNPEIQLNREDFPVVYFLDNVCEYIFAAGTGVGGIQDLYFTKLDLENHEYYWKPLYKKHDQIDDFFVLGDNLFLKSFKDAPNYKILKTKLSDPNIQNAQLIVPEDTNAVIKEMDVTSEGLFYIKTKNGVDSRLYNYKNGVSKEIPLPKRVGSINLYTKSSPKYNDLWIRTCGWVNKFERFKFDLNKNKFLPENLYKLTETPVVDDAIVEEIEVISHDGVMVPLSIIYKKGTKKEGNNRVLLNVYGAYGISWKPALHFEILDWLKEGGIFAVAHVRGGGEKGETWHKGGYKTTKANSWKDFITCAEHLISNNYTSPDKLAISGTSAGGIVIGRAITERPDLFAAAILNVPMLNTLRQEFGYNGANNIKEFGTVNDSTEFFALLNMDSYYHTKAGVDYPALLVTAGINDARVPIWHSAKYVAKMQELNPNGKPVLYSIDFEGGHGVSQGGSKLNKKITDKITFALWQTGHPDYQLKKTM